MGRIADAINGLSLPQQKRRQMLTLDEEFSEMEAQIQTLKTENQRLQAKVNPLERDVQRLQQQIEQMKPRAGHLDETADKLLQMISTNPKGMNKEALGNYFDLTPARTDYYFDILIENSFIHVETLAPLMRYGTTPAGRKYLVSKNLI
jgi:hypothetical protein